MPTLSLTPGPLDLVFTAGDRVNFTLVLCDPVSDEDPTPNPASPLDLTGTEIAAQIRAFPGSPVLATVTILNADTLGADGVVTCRIPEDQTAALRSTRASVWDLEILWPDERGLRTTLAGTVTATPDVTRLDEVGP